MPNPRTGPVSPLAAGACGPANSRGADDGGQATGRPSSWLRDMIFATLLAAVTFAAYAPAWHGLPIWDDNEHITRPELQSLHGLYRIWFEVGATLQYYPLLHSAFWLEHRLWGDAPLGYHWTNLAQHALSAFLLLRILRRLEVPGAWLAAAIFALHPVHVESVAWISEQKNTLSGVFYLGAALSYLHFDASRKGFWYLAAAGLFVLALLCKTVTGTLPGGLLVVLWWKHGRLSWRRDVAPLVPLLVLGAAGGLVTAWWERHFNQCVGGEFAFSPLERLLIAGRTAWFCCGKLLWPAQLTFIYPRWHLDAGDWRQYLPLAATAVLLAVAWLVRRRLRSVLAAALFYGGTLFPVLGFLNLYTFRYSFVADHYQYLASLALIALLAAGGAVLLERRPAGWRAAGRAAALGLLALLAGLTWRQSATYGDVETLYRTTIDRNPECWMAYNNLAHYLAWRGRLDEAVACLRKAVQLKPDYADAYYNLGTYLDRLGRFDEAVEELRTELKIDPHDAAGRRKLGMILARRDRCDEAIRQFQSALAADPRDAESHYQLGLVLARRGAGREALNEYRAAIASQPRHFDAAMALGNALAACGQFDEAWEAYTRVLAIAPDCAEAHNNLGNLLASRGQLVAAIDHYQRALAIKPGYANAHYNLGNALIACGQIDAAREQFAQARSLAAAQHDGNLVQRASQRLEASRRNAPPPAHAAP